MKGLFLILFSMIVVHLNAQLSFFVKPSINYKAHISSTDPFHFSDYAVNPSQYYQYNSKELYLPVGLDLGITTGFTTKNRRCTFEIGIQGDQTQSGMELFFINTNDGSHYYNNSISHFSGVTFRRYTFEWTFLMKTWESGTRFSFLVGAGYGRAKNHGNKVLGLGVYSSSFQVGDSTWLSFESGAYQNIRTNTFVHCGIVTEWHVKNKYLFDVNIFYSHGFKPMSSMETTITVYDKGISNAIGYSSVSSGSGLYLQLARKLQVYPRKNRKKEEI